MWQHLPSWSFAQLACCCCRRLSLDGGRLTNTTLQGVLNTSEWVRLVAGTCFFKLKLFASSQMHTLLKLILPSAPCFTLNHLDFHMSASGYYVFGLNTLAPSLNQEWLSMRLVLSEWLDNQPARHGSEGFSGCFWVLFTTATVMAPNVFFRRLPPGSCCSFARKYIYANVGDSIHIFLWDYSAWLHSKIPT